jgi:membrane protease YdiL (CAAX protease family)
MRWLAFLCPPVWLAAFVVGRKVGLVPAIVGASVVLTVLSLAAEGRAILRLFRPRVRGLAFGLVAAAAAVVVPYAGFRLLGAQLAAPTHELYSWFPDRDLLHAFVICGVVVAEEISWRGFVQSSLDNRVLLSAFVYATAHVTSGSWLLVALAFTMGVLWSWLRKATGGLVAPLLSHLAFDLCFLFWLRLG